jgi:hypothetical protein
MPSSTLHRLTEKKGKQLSKFLGIDSVPSTQLIANMQSRINNPIFKLSIEDYEAMCENKMMSKMMSKIIGCEEKQLKKFCKYINVFAENIKSSPKSIKNKMKVTNSINASMRRGSLNVLPDDILEKIVNKYKTLFKIKYVLKDWVPPEKLDWVFLSGNPNAIDLLRANRDKIDWEMLSANPSAMDLLKANFEKIDWGYLSINPSQYAIELLNKKPENIDWEWLSGNPNPNAIDLLNKNQDKIDWEMLSANPSAIELLKANFEKIDWQFLSRNPNTEAIKLLKNNTGRIAWWNLSKNPNPEAMELLKANSNEIVIKFLSMNPNPEAIEILKANQRIIDWHYLSRNQAIFDEILE